ncbi:Uncharacterised protein [Streptococcus pneumoniae]|nr:hypothetical protein B4079_1155 [Bacillus cereus]CKF53294.1 Uncharacterised protein [Streptococcus pneumoniae]CKG53342.1 Uncharacterised protein [Streptococcus pneumoniae]
MPTDEKLWFILNRNNPEGLIFTNEQEPIRMEGENRSKDLYKIYRSIQTNIKKSKKLYILNLKDKDYLLFLTKMEKKYMQVRVLLLS